MITIEHWPEERWPDNTLAIKASTFVRYNRKRVDPWFARYVQGQEPPNYPMPAIRRKHTWFVDNNGLCHAVAIGKRWFARQDT